MDNPIFKLEGVVHERSAETLQDFEGPLDLILFLLSKNKIEIQDIPIALILEQYLAYLEQRKQLDLEVASEFITMAAHLMYIKTRMLLSIEDEEAQNEMEQLIQSLKERQQKDTYLRIRTLTETLEAIHAAHAHGMKAIVSHRSGETTDDFITDLAVAVRAEGLKAGAPVRGERVAKYNRLVEIALEDR